MTTTTRFAPSPTGYLHIGSLRTVLYNYLYTKQKEWKFLLRIEDTDRSRFVEGSAENLIEVLSKCWLDPDEGPHKPGNVGPYLQSERLDIYQKHIDELLEKDAAYHCFCTSEELTNKRTQQQELWLQTKYDGTCRYLSDEEREEKLSQNTPYTIRLKVPKDTDVVFEDMIKWKITINTRDIDDQVLLKTDGFPTYHFAVVVDDHLMNITDIIRGDEWISSTPKHVLLFNAFGWEIPTLAHVPPLVGAWGKKLSKRTGDVAVEKYLEKGYPIESLINYLALLGWNPKTTEEFFTLEELIERFEIMNVHKSWAFFDVERLDFFSNHYLKHMSKETAYARLQTYLTHYDPEFLETLLQHPETYNLKIIDEAKGRMKKFADFKELTTCFYSEPNIPETDLIINPKMKITSIEDVMNSLALTKTILEEKITDFDDMENIKNAYIENIKASGMKNGQVLWPTRCALSWEKFSPWAFEMAYILGKEESLTRLNRVIQTLAV